MPTPLELCAFPLTPLRGETVDDGALAGLVSRLAAAGVDSVGVLGSTGVYVYLSREERRAALDAAVAAAGAVPVIAGVGALRTRDVLACADDAQAAGVSALLLAPVSYHRLREEEVLGLFTDVASSSSVPIVVYDNPATTGFTFTDALHARLAQHGTGGRWTTSTQRPTRRCTRPRSAVATAWSPHQRPEDVSRPSGTSSARPAPARSDDTHTE